MSTNKRNWIISMLTAGAFVLTAQASFADDAAVSGSPEQQTVKVEKKKVREKRMELRAEKKKLHEAKKNLRKAKKEGSSAAPVAGDAPQSN